MKSDDPESENGNEKIVLFADEFYMKEESISAIEKEGRIVKADCNREEQIVKIIKQHEPQVIVSEYFRVTEEVMKASESIKGIVVWGSGYDHVDVDRASKKGIYVANTSGSNGESVAEHTFSLILALTRKIANNYDFIQKGRWMDRKESNLPEKLRSWDLKGKNLGVIGLGSVGFRVAKIGRNAFDMSIFAYDPYSDRDFAKDEGWKLCGLDEVLSCSDVVTLHTPLTDETKNLINGRELSLMKPNAVIINTARGGIIEESALIDSLKNEEIRGAGLDVFSSEPINTESPLLNFENVVVTPHCAGNSMEALDKTSEVVSREIVRIFRGKTPKNLVNRDRINIRN